MKALISQRRQGHDRDKRHVVAQWQQLTFNRINQLAMVAAREVAAPYSAFENHIAGNQQTRGIVKEKPRAPAY